MRIISMLGFGASYIRDFTVSYDLLPDGTKPLSKPSRPFVNNIAGTYLNALSVEKLILLIIKFIWNQNLED